MAMRATATARRAARRRGRRRGLLSVSFVVVAVAVADKRFWLGEGIELAVEVGFRGAGGPYGVGVGGKEGAGGGGGTVCWDGGARGAGDVLGAGCCGFDRGGIGTVVPVVFGGGVLFVVVPGLLGFVSVFMLAFCVVGLVEAVTPDGVLRWVCGCDGVRACGLIDVDVVGREDCVWKVMWAVVLVHAVLVVVLTSPEVWQPLYERAATPNVLFLILPSSCMPLLSKRSRVCIPVVVLGLPMAIVGLVVAQRWLCHVHHCFTALSRVADRDAGSSRCMGLEAGDIVLESMRCVSSRFATERDDQSFVRLVVLTLRASASAR